MKKQLTSRSGFTLIEVLVVLAIIGILIGLVSALWGWSIVEARKTTEIAAARNLITAYVSASVKRGNLIAGYDTSAKAVTAEGDPVSYPASARYPWRLAPYFNYDFEGTTLVSNNQDSVDPSDVYAVSLSPSFGINAYCVGGYKDGSDNFKSGIVHNLSQARFPSSLIVFASAHTKLDEGGSLEGNHIISPPKIGSASWSDEEITGDSEPLDSGNVHFRHNGTAVVAFLDGSVADKSPDELRDMRLWSNEAAKKGDADYRISTGTSSGSGSSGSGRKRR